jgi:hypothetical protein
MGKRLGQAVFPSDLVLHRGASKRNGKGVVRPRSSSNRSHPRSQHSFTLSTHSTGQVRA